MAIILNEENFKETIKEGITLVDFWAEWCGPCQQMLPILEDFSKQMEGKMKVGKVNVDENPSISAEYRVMSIPTLIVLKDGELVDQMVWVKSVEELKNVCAKYL